MTNRNLRKKIRKAFEHATPDLAESIAIDSLLSDVPLKKVDDKPIKPTKPVKTPIQFRAIATLAASIAVVALLAGLISHTNPFAPPNNDDPALEQQYGSTNPPAVSDVDPDFSYEDLDWDALYKRYFIHRTDDFEFIFYHEVMQIDGRTCFVMAADYEHYGDFVIVDAQTEQVIESKELTGSYDLYNLFRYKHGADIDASTIFWNLEYVDGKICYRLTQNETVLRGLLVDAVTGEVLEKYILGGVIEDTTDPLNTEDLPADDALQPYDQQRAALNHVLVHAGQTPEGIISHFIEAAFEDGQDCYEITFFTNEHVYEYEIAMPSFSILSASKEYRKIPASNDCTTSSIDEQEARSIALNDPMVNKPALIQKVTKSEDDNIPYYNIYLTGGDYLYEVEISYITGTILSLEMEKPEILYGDEEHHEHDGTTPPDGKIGDENAIDAALRHAGLTIYDVNSVHCTPDADDDMPHYEVTFTYRGFDYKYEIGMYNAQLIRIEKEKH